MSAQKNRPTLDSLSSRFARKDPATGEAAAAPPTAAPASSETPAAPAARGGGDARVQILTRIDAATRKRLKMIAVEQDRTIQDICEEAIRDFVVRHTR